jgi:hypothetical protein
MFMQDITRLTATAVIPALPVTAGLLAGTPVETRTGWRPVERLRSGDAVHTLDGGLRRIAAIDRRWTMPGQCASLVRLPGGVFGCCAALDLLPDQHVLLDLDPCDPATGGLPDALAALVPAAALAALPGVARVLRRDPVQAVTLLFEEEELVWAATGVLAHCPALRHGPGALPVGETFPALGEAAARRLLAARTAEDEAMPGWI